MKKLVLSAMLTGLVVSSFAGIVYTDLDPDVVIGPSTAVLNPQQQVAGISYGLDMNGDQITDFGFSYADVNNGTNISSPNSSLVGPTILAGTNYDLDALSAGTIIGPSSQFAGSNGTVWVDGGPGASFSNTSQTYLGVWFDIGGNTHYGWIGVAYLGGDLTIKDFAYEDTPDTPIVAGDGIPNGNDECAYAVPLVVGTNGTCTSTSGDVAGMTMSLANTCLSTGANPDDDVWYSFTSVETGDHTVEVVSSSLFDAVVETFAGTCASPVSVDCVDESLGGTETIGVNGLLAGETYYIRVYDYSTGQPPTTTFNICVYKNTSVGINDQSTSNVSIYPNPANDFVTVELSDLNLETTSVRLVDVSGKTVHAETNIQNTKLQIDLASFDSGIYFVQVENNDNLKSFKLVKR